MKLIGQSKLPSCIAIIVALMSFFTLGHWLVVSFFPNRTIEFVFRCVCVFIFVYTFKQEFRFNNIKADFVLVLYLIWMLYKCLCSIPELKNNDFIYIFNVNCSGSLMIISAFFIAKPLYLTSIVKYFKLWTIPLTLIVAIYMEPQEYFGTDVFGFYLCFLQIYCMFWSMLKYQTRFLLIMAVLLIIYLGIVGDARSHFLKYSIAICLGYFSNNLFFTHVILSKFWLRIIHIILMSIPIFFLIVGLLGSFNVFEYGDNSRESLTDTRTHVYYESINSAINNQYIICGRNIVHGYDSLIQEKKQDDNSIYGNHYERLAEVGILNIFGWSGLVGVILYFLVFFHASYRALFCSNNKYMKIIGLYVSFRWIMCWIEDMQGFNSMNITLWILFSFCFLDYYNQMDDETMKKTIKSLNFDYK